MKKPQLLDIAVTITAVLVTVRFALKLHTHGVPTIDIASGIAVIAATVLLAAEPLYRRRAHSYVLTCPQACGLRIDARGQNPEDLAFLRALAADHTRHTPAGA